MKPAGCLIRVTGGDRLRETSGKFQPDGIPCNFCENMMNTSDDLYDYSSNLQHFLFTLFCAPIVE